MEENERQEVVSEEGMTFAQLMRIVWENILLIMLVTIWVTAFGLIYTFALVSPKYTAEGTVMVQADSNSDTPEQTAISIANALMTTYKEFVVSDLVLDSVLEDVEGIGDMSEEALQNSITISNTSGSFIIHVQVENTSPELAMNITNQIIANSIAIADDPDNGFDFLENKLKEVSPAKLPTEPSSPNKVLNVMISFILGLVLALLIVFFKELFNNKFQTKEDLEKVLNLRVIATVPGTIKERKLVD